MPFGAIAMDDSVMRLRQVYAELNPLRISLFLRFVALFSKR